MAEVELRRPSILSTVGEFRPRGLNSHFLYADRTDESNRPLIAFQLSVWPKVK